MQLLAKSNFAVDSTIAYAASGTGVGGAVLDTIALAMTSGSQQKWTAGVGSALIALSAGLFAVRLVVPWSDIQKTERMGATRMLAAASIMRDNLDDTVDSKMRFNAAFQECLDSELAVANAFSPESSKVLREATDEISRRIIASANAKSTLEQSAEVIKNKSDENPENPDLLTVRKAADALKAVLSDSHSRAEDIDARRKDTEKAIDQLNAPMTPMPASEPRQ